MKLLSPENRERIGMTTEALMAGGFLYGLLGVFTTENLSQHLVLSWVVPAVLWSIGAAIRRDVSIRRSDTIGLGFSSALTLVIANVLLKSSQLETGRLATQAAAGGFGLLFAATTTLFGRSFIQELIHPQVPPAE